MDDNGRYNGWTNYATWGVALVLDNEEHTYNEVNERVAQIKTEADMSSQVIDGIWTIEQAAAFNAADFLKDYVEELCNPDDEGSRGFNPNLMQSQVMSAGLAEVDWDEVANHYLSALAES